MHYSYHNRIRQRINNGELAGVEKSEKAGYAFVLVFSTPPITRPVKDEAAWRYEDVLSTLPIENSAKQPTNGQP